MILILVKAQMKDDLKWTSDICVVFSIVRLIM